MDTRDLIIGLMASFHRKQYSIGDLKALTGPFQVRENALRTALSRLKKQNWLDSKQDNNRACYFFTERGSFKSMTVAQSFRQPDWSRWDGFFWGFLYSLPDGAKGERYRIRKKLEIFRFVPFYPGFWIRPKHSEDHFTDELMKIENASLISFRHEKPLPKADAERLWGLPELNSLYGKDIGLLKRGLTAGALSPQKALTKKMEIGNIIVPHLFRDPLLPERFLPADWHGVEVRRRFFDFDKKMTELSRPFWEAIFGRNE